MPLLAIAIALTFLTPFLNALFYISRFITPKKTNHGLWWGYKFRSSKMYLLSGYEVRMKDDLLLGTLAQLGVGMVVVFYGFASIIGLYPVLASLAKVFSGDTDAAGTRKKACEVGAYIHLSE